MPNFIKLPEVCLKQSGEFNEKWLQNIIASRHTKTCSKNLSKPHTKMPKTQPHDAK